MNIQEQVLEGLKKVVNGKEVSLESNLKELGLDKYVDGRKVIFVTGGSQGAKKFNEVVVNLALEKKSNKFFVVLCAGMKNYDAINEKLKQIKRKGAHLYSNHRLY